MRTINVFMFYIVFLAPPAFAEKNCIVINNPSHTDATSKFEISEPGNYCLADDLHARIDFADHPAEPRLIKIWSSDVVLDLQGHTLGRGILFKNPGGVGIEIKKGARNIEIKNGTLQDFYYGIYRGVAVYSGATKRRIEPTYDAKSNSYRFEHDNIVIQNVRYKNNKENLFFEEEN